MRPPILIAAGAAIGAVGLVLAGGAGLVDPTLARAGAVVGMALALWVSGVLPEPVTALGFFLLAVLLAVAPPGVVFSGFASTAFWLVFGGLLVGMAVKRTGLGERLAHALVSRVGGSYLALCTGIAAVGMALGFLMPSSMGRVVLLLPAVLSLADHLGLEHGGRGRTGLVLLTGTVGFMPTAAILPAVVPNMVMVGAAESLYGVTFQYFPWLVAHMPTTGLVKLALIIGLIWALFRETPKNPPPVDHPGPLSTDERRLAVILTVTLALWATDGLHRISPAWVALAGGIACLLPPRPLVPMPLFNEKFNHAALLHLAGLISLGAVVAESGLGAAAGAWLMAVLPLDPASPAVTFTALAGLTSALGAVTTIPGVPAVMTPLADSLAQASGLPVATVLMIQAVGYTTVLLPYQVPPLIIAMSMGGVPLRSAAVFTLSLAAASALIAWPLTYAWWRLIGLLPG
ncbi:SLC13 family permease [Novispirillum sp. DQ9]|uniref:SLC13 family permease n=1 Tax=Novispirillum sp. DQ9 TaxID=3398612 RepID=UPI003C7D0AB1